MREIIIGENEAGQRFDKYLFKYLKDAPKSFIYKMLRKKNITRNGKKADGSEKLDTGDVVKLFLADDTIEKFKGTVKEFTVKKHIELDIIYEDENILAVNKPSGILSQKSVPEDESLNEYIIDYLLKSGRLTYGDLNTFRPSVCNRLDRNTSGIVLAGCSLKGIQELSAMFKERSIDKYYYCFADGVMKHPHMVEGYLKKSDAGNYVEIKDRPYKGAFYIKTYYEPVKDNGKITFLKVKLITGKTHQIRSHLSFEGHGIIGDYKYGNRKANEYFREKYGVKDQLLHAAQMIFPETEGELSYLAGLNISAELPADFKNILKGEFE